MIALRSITLYLLQAKASRRNEDVSLAEWVIGDYPCKFVSDPSLIILSKMIIVKARDVVILVTTPAPSQRKGLHRHHYRKNNPLF